MKLKKIKGFNKKFKLIAYFQLIVWIFIEILAPKPPTFHQVLGVISILVYLVIYQVHNYAEKPTKEEKMKVSRTFYATLILSFVRTFWASNEAMNVFSLAFISLELWPWFTSIIFTFFLKKQREDND